MDPHEQSIDSPPSLITYLALNSDKGGLSPVSTNGNDCEEYAVMV